jgi:hypothetical protein
VLGSLELSTEISAVLANGYGGVKGEKGLVEFMKSVYVDLAVSNESVKSFGKFVHMVME